VIGLEVGVGPGALWLATGFDARGI